MIHEFAELVSLGYSWPAIVLGSAVVFYWFRPAWEAFHTPARVRTDTQWLILGVVVGFAGSVIDNSYWGLAWTFSYAQSPLQDTAFESGVYFNIPFRQLCGLYAAYCHLEAWAGKDGKKRKTIARLWYLSALLGFIYALSLLGWFMGRA